MLRLSGQPLKFLAPLARTVLVRVLAQRLAGKAPSPPLLTQAPKRRVWTAHRAGTTRCWRRRVVKRVLRVQRARNLAQCLVLCVFRARLAHGQQQLLLHSVHFVNPARSAPPLVKFRQLPAFLALLVTGFSALILTLCAGRFSNSSGVSTCYLCPFGKYLPIAGQQSVSACIDCPKTVHCPAGSSSASSACKPARLLFVSALCSQVPLDFSLSGLTKAASLALLAISALRLTRPSVLLVSSALQSAPPLLRANRALSTPTLAVSQLAPVCCVRLDFAAPWRLLVPWHALLG